MDKSGRSSPKDEDKLIVPDKREDEERSQSNSEKMHLSVDPDCVDDDDDDDEPGPLVFGDGIRLNADEPPVQNVDSQQSHENKREKLKIVVGISDDEDEIEETDGERRLRIAQEMNRLRHENAQEEFNIEDDGEVMKAFIRDRLNEAIFPTDNAIASDGHIFKRKGPKMIEGYLWGAVIGTGSYGKVKEVIDSYTLTRRAAKIMKYDKIKKIPNGWANIRGEMKILNLLTHRNIIKLIEVFDIPDKKKVYMIFEYCIGSVQQLLDIEPAKRLTIGESHMIFRELIHGLDYLHSKRISHKDIKPGNLLVAIDFTIKICDFGVAEEIPMFQNNGLCTKVNGTPKFQPPECVAGNHDCFDGFKADIWSAGVTLYNMVSGKYPFESERLYNLYDTIARDPLVMPTNVELSPNLKDLLYRMLEKDFEARFGTCDILPHSWFVTSFPEDAYLGRIMERMRTGDRPLTMKPSLQVKYDGPSYIEEVDENGQIVYVSPILTEGGELDQDSFNGFKFISAPVKMEGIGDDSSLEPARRPSSRSTPTSAPIMVDPGVAPIQQPVVAEVRPRQRRSIFSCIFRRRSGS